MSDRISLKTEHRWSGWPGAVCLDCGAPDPREVSLAEDCEDCYDGFPNDPPRFCERHQETPCPAKK